MNRVMDKTKLNGPNKELRIRKVHTGAAVETRASKSKPVSDMDKMDLESPQYRRGNQDFEGELEATEYKLIPDMDEMELEPSKGKHLRQKNCKSLET